MKIFLKDMIKITRLTIVSVVNIIFIKFAEVVKIC